MAFVRRPRLESLEDRFAPASLLGSSHLPGWALPGNPSTGAIALEWTAAPSTQGPEIRWDGGGADQVNFHPRHPSALALRDTALTSLVQSPGESSSLPIEDRVFAAGNGFLAG